MKTTRHRTIWVLGAVTVCMLTVITVPASARTNASVSAAPSRGGSLTYGLEAETDTTNGYCLPAGQLAASGIQVVSAVYDTLVTINSKGAYVPYLAKTVEPNETFTEWTITLREGVTFHDGTALNADVLKLNLDTYRGKNPSIPAALSAYNFSDVSDVVVKDPLTVVVTTKRPWPAFPAFLFGSGRIGILARAQLADRQTCATNLIGTGPFKFVDWTPGESLEVVRNDNYWRKGLPYLDGITFVPSPDPAQRVNGLLGGELDMIQTSGANQILQLEESEKNGEVNLVISDRGAEVAYGMLNVSKPPFDDIIARKAVAYAGDAVELNEIRNHGLFTIASGPFGPGSPAYIKDTGLYKHNLKKAKKLAAQYEAKHGEPLSFEYLTVPDPEAVALAALVQEQQGRAGIEVSVRTISQPELISQAISGQFQQLGFRNHPGGDPDSQYVWWHSGSLVNFGRINDPVIDDLLDRGRVETNPAKRTAIYKQLNKRFAKQLYNLWVWYTLWANATAPDVRGVAGPPLPDGGGKPFALFAGVIPVVGLSRSG
ncbi:MAG: ABC transporter substrate-binding protein [Acidimicrobiia bacterium]|nr:ABC transporter substrate-binding protein [Acidimicrobiia bacterium]